MQDRSIGTLHDLTAEALGLIGQLDTLGKIVNRRMRRALDRAWRLGVVLCQVKELVGWGNWLVWIEANLPIGERQAQRYMELAKENPTAKTVADLSAESVRKFHLQYVPDKERPEFPGDQKVGTVAHHLTLLNDFRRLQRRVTIGQVKVNSSEAKRDLWPVFEWLGSLYGLPTERLALLKPKA